jgi:nicotinamide-nucleotide amidase
MIAEIISIGNEILRGEITDTNASYLAAQLPLLGVELHWVTQVGDDQSRLVDAFRRAIGRSDLVLATGGLGPTVDDLTREALAETLGEELHSDPALEAGLRDLFAKWGRPMPSHNLKQAAVIPSAQPIPNHRGTAPGWWVEKGGKIAIVMPGPPGEMQTMWQEEIVPRLAKMQCGGVILCRTLKTFGVTEAAVDEMVAPVISRSAAEIGIYAKPDGIYLQVVAKGAGQSEAEEKIRETEASLREIIGEHIWGVDDDTLAGVIGKLLAERGKTLASMESYTGGALAASLSDAHESSRCYKGGFVVGSEAVGTVLDVPGGSEDLHGPSDGEMIAWAMARAARQRLVADIGVGVHGSQGDQSRGAVVFIAVTDGQRERSRQTTWPPLRRDTKHWVAVAAMFELRRLLLDVG